LIRKALNRFWQVIASALRQGATPRKLAIACAMGCVISIFPVFGTTTLLCFLVAIAFRLNIVVIQTVNYLLTPIQVVMLIPFMQGGIFLFSLSNVSLEVNDLLFRFKNDFGTVFQELGGVVLSGIAVWVLVAIPLFFLLFFIFHALLLRWMRREVKELT
jgi:uncharacterized protein (DUF2062 family)